MTSLNVMLFDLEMNRILTWDEIKYMPHDEIRFIYAVYELEQDYDGPHSHGPPLAAVIDVAVDYGVDREWIDEYLDRSMNQQTAWSIRTGHIKICSHAH